MPLTESEIREFQIKEFEERFSKWKEILRGRVIWNEVVDLAPIYHTGIFKLPEPIRIDDLEVDAPNIARFVRFLTFLGIADGLRPPKPIFDYSDDPAPKRRKETIDPVELQIELPEMPRASREWWEWMFENFAKCRQISFEIVAAKSKITFQFTCDEEDRLLVKAILAKAFPGITIREMRRFLKNLLSEGNYREYQTVEYGLGNDFVLPIMAWQPHELDPLVPIVDTLGALNSDECGVYQVSFAVADWWRNDLAGLCRFDMPVPYERAFPNTPRGLAKQKISRPFVCASVRMMLRTHGKEKLDELFALLDDSFRVEQHGSNYLTRIPILHAEVTPPYRAYNRPDQLSCVMDRSFRHTGMLLSHDELYSLVHFPMERAAESRVRLVRKKTKPPKLQASPADEVHGGLFGYNEHGDGTSPVLLTEEQRSRHTYVIGVSGTGKSTLLFSLILQDTAVDRGCAVIDPHGDLIEKLLEYLPQRRLKDVVLIDPSDEEYPVGFNVLSANSDAEKNILASDLVAVFRRLSTAWGDQMNTVLANAILAFLEHPQGGTLVDLRSFLVDKEFRLKFLAGVQDEGVRYYWQKEFPLLSGKPQGPILTRLDAFLRPKMIRNMVAQKENKLDFPAIMREKKIVLMKLSHGAIGEENAYLLGSLFVSRFYQAALGRQNIPEKDRSLFNLYIDEFHNFVTPSIASILSGGRKYGLGLTLAHQELRQLWSRDEQVASAVLANPATRICFRTGEWDAQKLAEGLSFFDAKDIQSLGRGDTICRVDTADNDFNMTCIPLDLLVERRGREWAEQVKAASRERYAVPRASLQVSPPPPEETIAPEPPPASPPAPVSPPAPKPPRAAQPKPVTLSPEPEAETPLPREASPGKGGQQHKYLQEIVKRLGQERGFLAEIEKSVLDGAGSIDVSLIRSDKKIACEISITTGAAHEIRNAQKCLACGYDAVALISPNSKTLMQLKRLASELEESERAKLHFLSIDEFIEFLDAQGVPEASSEGVVREWKFKTDYKNLTPEEIRRKKNSISQTIAAALKRLKGD